MFGQHAAFIIPSYLASASVIIALVIWTLIEYKAQRREISRLEEAGFKRRSAKQNKDSHV